MLAIIRNSYTMGCPPVRGDNPRALASGLSYVLVDKHGITILYHLHQCRLCTSREMSCLSWLGWHNKFCLMLTFEIYCGKDQVFEQSQSPILQSVVLVRSSYMRHFVGIYSDRSPSCHLESVERIL